MGTENLGLYPNDDSSNGQGTNYEYGDNTSPYQFNVVPFQIEDNLDFIDIHEDGTTLLGSSNISGKYWNGSVWSFKDADFAPAKEKCLSGFGLEFGVTCGKFLNSSQNIIIGNEGGGVTTMKFQDITNVIQCMPLVTSYSHDQDVTSVSVSKDSQCSVTSSTDSSIVVWENENLITTKKYSPAHSREVTSVVVSKYHSNFIFGSASIDGCALIWDQREEKPAFCVKEDCTEPLTSLDWKSENEIAVGSSIGNLYLIDVRNQKVLNEKKVLSIPIVDIKFNKYGLLAVAGVWKEVNVWNFEDNTCVYKDSRHSGNIRSMCWSPINDSLYTCGAKKEIFRHNIDLSAYSKVSI